MVAKGTARDCRKIDECATPQHTTFSGRGARWIVGCRGGVFTPLIPARLPKVAVHVMQTELVGA